MRLAVSVLLVTIGVTVGVLLAPRLVRYLGTLAQSRLEKTEIDVEEQVEAAEERVGLGLPTRIVVRAFQTTVLVGLSLSLLLVWGYESIATRLALLLGTSVPVLGKGLLTLTIGAVAYFGTGLIEDGLAAYAAESRYINEHREGVAFRVLQMTILLSAGFIALSLWGIDLGGILVGAGFAGIVIGMAARQTLGALIAGLVLMFARPFEIGDWIEVGDATGIVTDITIINTRMRNISGEHIVIPNDKVSQSTIVNRTREGRLRLTASIGVDYETDIERAEELAVESALDVPSVLDTPRPSVVPTQFGDSAIVLELRFWIKSPSAAKQARTRADVIREIKTRYDEAGITIPFPQVEISERESD
jgi:small-conductance mechanosensitive channel